MVKALEDLERGAVVKVWAIVTRHTEGNENGISEVELDFLGGEDGGTLLLSPRLLVEEVAADEPWPGELARVSYAAATRATEIAWYGESGTPAAEQVLPPGVQPD